MLLHKYYYFLIDRRLFQLPAIVKLVLYLCPPYYYHNNYNLVKEGDIIKTGQVIAKVGTTGNSTGNHLHFETIVNEENINPIEVIK